MNRKEPIECALPDLLARNRENTARGITFIQGRNESAFVPYSELYRKATGVLYQLQQRGVRPGNEVVLALADNNALLTTFWACLFGKFVPVPLPAGKREEPLQKIAGVWKQLRDPWLIAAPEDFTELNRYIGETGTAAWDHRFINAAGLLAVIHQQAEPVSCDRYDLAYLQFSSGSTGAPKGVMLTHANVVTNILDIIARSQMTEADRPLSWMPLTHDMGLICFHLSALAACTDQFIMDTSLFVRNPVLWIEKANEHRATQLYSPNFGYHYFLDAFNSHGPVNWDLSCIRIIYNGAEPISYALCRRFAERLSAYGLHPRAMFPGYGLAEASVAVSLPNVHDGVNVYYLSRRHLGIGQPVNMADEGGVPFVENGYPVDHCQVRICGNDSEVYGEGITGNVEIKGEHVTTGYYNNREATLAIITADGWLRTGDLGFMLGGRLVITGRSKNMIIINGQNHYPQDLEAMIAAGLEPFGLGKAVVCGVRSAGQDSEALVVFLLYKGSIEQFVPYARAVRELVAEKAGLMVTAVVPVRKIPKTTSGKVQHFKLAALYREGAFETVCSRIDALLEEDSNGLMAAGGSVTDTLQRLWEHIHGTPLPDAHTPFFEAGMTSLSATRFLGHIQKHLRTGISLAELFDHPDMHSLATLLTEKKALHTNVAKPVEEQDHYGVTAIQKRFWLLGQLAGNAGAHHIGSASLLLGECDVSALQEAIGHIIGRHEVFRTVFTIVDGTLRQRIMEPNSFRGAAFQYIDHRGHRCGMDEMATLAKNEIYKPFDLACGPLFRCTLFHLAPQQYLFVLSMHHTIADGWSAGLLMRDIKAFYQGRKNGLPGSYVDARMQFRDFAAWQNAQLRQPGAADDRQYWKRVLSGEPATLALAFARPRGAVQTFSGKEVRGQCTRAFSMALEAFASRQQATPFMVVAAALRTLLYRYSGQHDLVIGTDTAGRMQPESEFQPGCFINTLPLRVRIEPNESFSALLQKEKRGILGALDHQAYPFDHMVEDLGLKKDFSRAPLFDVLLLFRNLHHPLHLEGIDERITVETISIPAVATMVDLEFEFYYEHSALCFALRYNNELFTSAQMERMAAHLVQLLQSVVEQPDQPVAVIDLLTAAERMQWQQLGCGEHRPPAFTDCIAAFEQRVAQHPHAVALVCGDQHLTWHALNEEVNRLTDYLVSNKLVARGDHVGLMKKRSARSIADILAIWKAGGAYVPVDPDYPAERARFVLEDAGCRLLITDLYSWKEFSGYATPVLFSDELSEVLQQYSPDDPGIARDGEMLAYILYTSGTTGKPKGVMIQHKSVIDYVHTFAGYFCVTPADKVIQQSSLMFDVSVEEIFGALYAGARLVVAVEGGKDVEALLGLVATEQATILSTTPPVIDEINRQCERTGSLRALISGGDRLKPAYIDRLLPRVAIYNTYGPTETTVCVTYHKVSGAHDADVIGKPLPNHTIYLLDERMNPVPVGIAGEICIAGAGVAKGYLNRLPESAAFADNPFVQGDRLYKTGDMGCWQEDGSIRFLGRKDAQLKVHGYRLEPSEIEQHIVHFEGIRDAVVKMAGLRPRLTAYIAARPDTDLQSLRHFLAQRLPVYMIPATFVPVDAFPLTSTGKVDYQALPDPGEADNRIDHADSQPQNEAEAAMLGIFREVLQGSEAGMRDNLFELGGNSLHATRILSRMHSLGARLTLRDLFAAPDIRALASWLPERPAASLEAITRLERQTQYPLSLAQRRLWVLHQLDPQTTAYNLCWSFRLEGKDIDRHFCNALQHLVHKHECLRASFGDTGGEPFMHIADRISELRVTQMDMRKKPDALHWEDLIREDAAKPFDLRHAPLFRVLLLQTDDEAFRCGFVIHHIITDGWSMEIIWNELNAYIEAGRNGKPVHSVPPAVGYMDFAAWQLARSAAPLMKAHRDYWRQKLQGNIAALDLRLPKPAGGAGSRGKTAFFYPAPALVRQLEQMAGRYDTTVFTVYLALLKLLLYKYSGQQDIVVAAPFAGRNHQDIEHCVGYFLNILPLRTGFEAEASFESLIVRVRNTVMEAYTHQDLPVERMLEDLFAAGSVANNPLFDVMLVLQNFHNMPDRAAEEGNRTDLSELREVDNETCIGGLLFEINHFTGVPTLKIRYDAALFTGEQISRMAVHFERLAEQVLQYPALPLRGYNLLTDEERDTLLGKTDTASRLPAGEETVVSRFAQMVQQMPHKVAIAVNDRSVSYAALDALIDALVRRLHALGEPLQGRQIAILCERSEWMIVSMMAVLRCGASWVPVDTTYPRERTAWMIRSAGADIVLCDNGIEYSKLYTDIARVMDVRAVCRQAAVHATSVPPAALQPHHTAYVMYTSGSTGTPKGVVIPHAALTDYVNTFTHYFQLTANDRVIQQSSPAFDVSVEEIFPALCAGATLVMLGGAGLDPAVLARLVQEERATLLSTTPLVVAQLNRQPALLHSLRILISGGDKLTPKAIDELPEHISVFNTYGPTETTVCATYHPVSRAADAALIGKPIANHSIYILDEGGNLLPEGMTGEICIAGAGVASGYLGLPAETSDRFTSNPFRAGERMYRTGDLGRWQADGNLVFAGRKDSQVKINGYRIEVAEIEAALIAHDAIDEALVQAVQQQDQSVLVAWVVPTAPVTLPALQGWLAERLPYYMLPAAILMVDAFPRTVQGKIDLAALPQPGADKQAGSPATIWEQELADIWRTVLKQTDIHRHDNFFILGGTSIEATRLVNRVAEKFSYSLPLQEVFRYPVLHQLAARLQEAGTNRVHAIEPAPAQAYYEVSNAQQRIWILSQLEQEHPAYHIFLARRLNGQPDIALLSRCAAMLVERHESLRTTFHWVDGALKQRIHSAGDFDTYITCSDIRNTEDVEAGILQAARAEQTAPFDLENGPLFRIRLLQTGEEAYVLFFTLHHIIADGWSVALLSNEMHRLYAALQRGHDDPPAPLAIQYKDYARYINNYLLSPAMQVHQAYWVHRFADGIPMPELPTDRPRPGIRSGKGGSEQMELDETLTRALRQVAQASEATLFMVLMASLKAMLYRYTNESDWVIGTPVSGRISAALENQVGCYINTLPVRTAFAGHNTFTDLLQQVKQSVLEAFQHQVYPFDQLVDRLQPERNLGRNPLFDIMLAMQEVPLSEPQHDDRSVDSLPLYLPAHAAKLDLTLYVFENGSGLQLVLEYNTDIFNPMRMLHMLRHYRNILQHIVQEPACTLGQLRMMDEGEQQQILEQFNEPGAHRFEFTDTVVDMIRSEARARPQQTALVCEGQLLTYEALNGLSDRLAQYLTVRCNLQPGQPVGLMTGRSPQMLVALLAILKAGAAYVPLDPDYPPYRTHLILHDTALKLVLTEAQYIHAFDEDVTCIPVDVLLQQALPEAPAESRAGIAAGNTAYIIYTSGSTGRPKGIRITHRNVSAFITWALGAFANDGFDIVYAATSYCFDLSVFELLYPLCAGKTIRLLASGLEIGQHLEEDRNVLINTVPSVVEKLVEDGVSFAHVRSINMAGEPIPAALPGKLLHQSIKIRNLYGPSEDTTYSTCYVFPGNDPRVLIGKPVAFTQVFVLDENRLPVPVGVPGELAIAGEGLAAGYLNNPELTAEKFIAHPLAPQGRLYLTGDRACWTAEGNLQFLGRKDHQVKLRGYRIEPGEIENVFASIAGIGRVCVMVTGQPAAGQLTAFYTTTQPVSEENIVASLKAWLPAYMIPYRLVRLETFPRSPNGKVDREALLQYADASQPYVRAEAQTETEQTVAAVWSEVLGREVIGLDDNFFAVGGHSIRAAGVAARLSNRCGVQLALRDIFLYPTIRSLAKHIELCDKVPLAAITACEEQQYYPVTHMQRRLWTIDQLEPGNTAYNMSGIYRINGALKVEALEKAYRWLAGRHEILRARFGLVNGTVRQFTSPLENDGQVLHYEDLQGCTSEQNGVPERALALAAMPFDLQHGPPVRVHLLRVQDDSWFLVVSMHHIISDGWSMQVIVKEMTEAYKRITCGLDLLPPLPFQYRDFAAWYGRHQHTAWFKKQQEYWRRQLEGPIEPLELPADQRRPARKTYSGAAVSETLPESLLVAVNRLAVAQQVTPFMVMCAALNTLLYRYTGNPDICIGIPAAGRWHAGLEEQVGFYVNTLVLRTHIDGEEPFAALLQQVGQRVLAALDHQHYPFDRLVEELPLKRDLSRSPLFDVMLVFRDEPGEQAWLGNLPGLQIQECTMPAEAAKFDLTITIAPAHAGREITVVYNRDIFNAARMRQLLDHFSTLLHAIVADPGTAVGRLDLLPGGEKQRVEIFSAGRVMPLAVETITAAFAQQVLKTPHAVALVWGSEQLTYRALDRASNRLARWLQQHGHVQPGNRAGLMMDRSLNLVVGILAILKAGAAYVPIDPAYPEARRRYMTEHSRLTTILTERKYGQSGTDVTYCYADDESIHTMTDDALPVHAAPADAAYVIYTSGTTGRPKGVAIAHHSVMNLCSWVHSAIYNNDKQPKNVLLNASVGFDSSVKQLFPPLLAGSTLLLAPETVRKDPKALAALLQRQQVDVWDCTPGYLSYVLHEVRDREGFPAWTLAGGEPLAKGLIKKYYDLFGRRSRLVNLYGVTEATVDSTWCIADPEAGGHCNIGKPLPNTFVYILDRHQHPAPPGIPGELYIGGRGVAIGYLYDHEKTKDRFVDNPFGNGLLYRTGDLAKWLPDGSIDFIGRNDHQVKINGYRIEPAEVEHTMMLHPGITAAHAATRYNGVGEPELIAWYVMEGETSGAALTAWLQQQLPAYMVPAWLVPVSSLPLNAHGKIDTAALPDPAHQAMADLEAVDETETEVETELLAMWKEVLERSPIGVNDNFFDIGGNSLKVIRLYNRIREKYPDRLEIHQIFSSPTIRKLSRLLENASAGMRHTQQETDLIEL